jgi:hypothetical protein
LTIELRRWLGAAEALAAALAEQRALNAERAVLAIKHAAAPYTAPYTHDKPRAAAADATCGLVSDAAGACLGHAALRYTQPTSPPARGTEEGGWSKTYFSNSILKNCHILLIIT